MYQRDEEGESVRIFLQAKFMTRTLFCRFLLKIQLRDLKIVSYTNYFSIKVPKNIALCNYIINFKYFNKFLYNVLTRVQYK